MNEDVRGKKIGSYEVVELIGEGGFGVVYRAYQPVVEREVVIKAILPLYANDPNFIRNFEAEAHLIARLEHLNIVPLYDFWRDPPHGAYLVMRYLRGGSLLDRFKVGELWDLDTVTRVLEQIAAALAVAHRNDIVHQDIKPANILLDEENNAYLTDFGIAKDLANSVNLASMGDEDVIHGSPAYIAPEQITRGDITALADIYSLGIVLYEMLAGSHPFEGLSLMELIKHQTDIPLPPLQEFRPELPEELNKVIQQATAKKPHERYENILDMAKDLREIVDNVDFVATPQPQQHAGGSVFRRGGAKESATSVISVNAAPVNPYKGLRSFEEADAADFFGRDNLIETIINHLAKSAENNRFLAVVGPSGSGKSSVVKAGALPTIRRSRDADWANCFIVEMTPGDNPLESLEDALSRIAISDTENIIERIRNDETGLLEGANHVLPDDDSELVLVIDQFEELYTLNHDTAVRARFLDNLYTAVTSVESRIRMIITLRADYYDRPLLYPRFGEVLRVNTQVVLPMDDDALRETIVEPANRAGLTLENGLVDLIIEDVNKQPGSLPLLQFMLTELYRRRDNVTLTIEAYRESGGVSGSLARSADNIYERLDADEREAVRQLFLRLVNISEDGNDTRRRAFQSELESLYSDKQVMRNVLEEFGKYRLVSFDNDNQTRQPTVEVAHEALIQRWERLREWIAESREELRIQNRLTTATTYWLNNLQDASYLARGKQLFEFEELFGSKNIALSTEERRFIEASIALRDREEQIRRRRVAILGSIAAVAIIAAVIAVLQTFEAVSERDRANSEAITSRSRELAASALANMDDIDLPLLLSLNAVETANTLEARDSLLTALQRQPRLRTFLHGHTQRNRSVAYSPDGRYIASGSEDGTIIVWDAATGQRIGDALSGHEDWINSIAFNVDSVTLASAGSDGTVRLWNVETGEQIGDPLTGHIEARHVVFSPDGMLLASSGSDGTVRLWNPETGEQIGEPLSGHEDIVYSLAFHPDGDLIASGSADDTIRLWDISDLEDISFRALTGHENWVFSVAFNPEGTILASGSADFSVRLWDVETGDQIGNALTEHREWVRTVVFSPSGRTLATGSEDNRVILWSLTGAETEAIRTINEGDVWSVAFSPDSREIAIGGDDVAVQVWYTSPQVALGQRLVDHQEWVLAVDVHPQNTLIASGGGTDGDFVIRIWDAQVGILLHALDEHAAQITDMRFNDDGTLLVSADSDGIITIWDTNVFELSGVIEAEDGIFSLALSGSTLAVGDNDGRITLWDIGGSPEAWSPIGEPLQAHPTRVVSLAFNDSGDTLISGAREGIRLWNVESRAQIGDLIDGHTDTVETLTFHPDGDIFASGSRDTTIRLWDVNTQEAVSEPLTGHENWVLGIAFSPDGRTLASASIDRRLIVWDVETRRMIGTPFSGHNDQVLALDYSDDGEFMVSGGQDGQVIIWLTGLNRWIERACEIANRDLTAEEIQQYFQDNTATNICSELVNVEVESESS